MERQQDAEHSGALKDQKIGRSEFIAMCAMMYACVAFSIDAMLPGLTEISDALDIGRVQDTSFILTVFMGGLGVGTLIFGPLSDTLGRKPVVYLGLCLFIVAGIFAWAAPDFRWLLIARFFQGLGAGAPRIVSMAIIRDLFSGRNMASIMSLTLMVFLIFPAFAPMLGALVLHVEGWRAIFALFPLFGLVLLVWFGLRMRETLSPTERRPFRSRAIASAAVELMRIPVARLSLIVQMLLMTGMFTIISTIEPIFGIAFGRAQYFPYWFGAIAALSALSSLMNARLVRIYGMRRIVAVALGAQILLSASALTLLVMDVPGGFAIFLFWLFGVMFQAGITMANLNAMALEPAGHFAGTAAAIFGSFSTFGGAVLASPLAALFDGTARPLIACLLVIVVIASILMQSIKRAEARAEVATEPPII